MIKFLLMCLLMVFSVSASEMEWTQDLEISPVSLRVESIRLANNQMENLDRTEMLLENDQELRHVHKVQFFLHRSVLDKTICKILSKGGSEISSVNIYGDGSYSIFESDNCSDRTIY